MNSAAAAPKRPGSSGGLRRSLRWLLTPWWAVQVFTAAKRCDNNPVIGSMRLNRRGLHVWRARVAHQLAQRRRQALFPGVDPAQIAQFDRDGLVVQPQFVPPELYAALVQEISRFRGDALETREGDAITRTFPLTAKTLQRLPACRTVLASPGWRRLLHYVASFDAAPSVFLQTVFSRAEPGKRDPQTAVHMDTFHPTMKAWLFLQEVTEEIGPFAYVPGSHRRTPRRDAWERRMSVEASDPSTPSRGGSFRVARDELARLGLPQPRPVSVPPNTLVAADTSGFHARTASSKASVRVAIYASCRRNPFQPWAGLNWRAPAAVETALWKLKWRLAERQARRGVRSQSRPVRDIDPYTPPQAWT